MPFIGKDWRSPGEAWVKTESSGWQRMKIIENQLHPSSCRQYHTISACSWPPPSQIGQHMADNCGRIGSVERRSVESRIVGCSDCASSDEVRISHSDGDSPSASSSGDCRGRSSCSVSPDKSNCAVNSHHHPITISSPYGRYSCCQHYLNQSPDSLSFRCCLNGTNKSGYNDCDQLPRSLSKDSFGTPDNAVDCSNTNESQRMRYINSFPDIRNSQNYKTLNELKAHRVGRPDGSNNNGPTSIECNNVSAPLILENGEKVCDNQRSIGDERPVSQDSTSNMSVNNSDRNVPEKSRSVSPQLIGGFCCACCCSNTGWGSNRQSLPTIQKPAQMDLEYSTKTIPHCRVSVRTREVAMYNTISEAFYRLDFYNAIHDIRRFNYICKLLHLLVTQNLTSLSGCATKVLFTMLEQVAWEVSSNKRNIHVIKDLLNELRDSIQKYYCWGRPIGSSALWQQHFDTIERITAIVEKIELSQTSNDQQNVTDQLTFDKLPREMIREVLLRLNDYRDLISSTQALPLMSNMIDEQSIWKKLCRYHFTEQQLKLVFESSTSYLSRVKRSTLRGIKYARTVSADGKVSYRNPVARKAANSTRNLPQTNNDRVSQSSDDSLSGGSSSDSDASSSHVIKTIRIFDREGKSTTLNHIPSRSSQLLDDKLTLFSSAKHAADHYAPPSNTGQQKEEVRVTNKQSKIREGELGQDSSSKGMTNSSSSEIDWELVFHQLRRRFDLKEEYADCLLLCRHCRCLFWKSIGHPCVKSEDDRTSLSRQPARGSTANNPSDNRSSAHFNPTDQQIPIDGLNNFNSDRPSVAFLSRSFDNRARTEDAENLSRLNARNGRLLHELRDPSRQPLGLRNMQEIDQIGIRRQINNNSDQHNSSQNRQSKSMNREELVPKHIIISPQAFLKFFSL